MCTVYAKMVMIMKRHLLGFCAKTYNRSTVTAILPGHRFVHSRFLVSLFFLFLWSTGASAGVSLVKSSSRTLNKTEAANRLLSSMTSFCHHPDDEVVLSCRLWIGRLSRAETDPSDTRVDAAVRCCLPYSNDQLINCLAVGCDQFKATYPVPTQTVEFPGLLKKRLQTGSLGVLLDRFRRADHKNAVDIKRDLARRATVEFPLKVKRWNSRLCMETHCRQSALDKLSYVTCGMQFCNSD